MTRVPPVALLAMPLAVLAACAQPTPYLPDRMIVRAIPADMAKRELGRLLAKAKAFYQDVQDEHNRLDGIEVGDETFSFYVFWKSSGFENFQFRYDEIEPRPYQLLDRYLVQLVGEPAANMYHIHPRTKAIWFLEREDLEMAVDALESLKDRGGSAPPSDRQRDVRGANVAPAAPPPEAEAARSPVTGP